jgi:hypothetical protein
MPDEIVAAKAKRNASHPLVNERVSLPTCIDGSLLQVVAQYLNVLQSYIHPDLSVRRVASIETVAGHAGTFGDHKTFMPTPAHRHSEPLQ